MGGKTTGWVQEQDIGPDGESGIEDLPEGPLNAGIELDVEQPPEMSEPGQNSVPASRAQQDVEDASGDGGAQRRALYRVLLQCRLRDGSTVWREMTDGPVEASSKRGAIRVARHLSDVGDAEGGVYQVIRDRDWRPLTRQVKIQESFS